MSKPELTKLVSALPTFKPFVGPEAQERVLGTPLRVRLGANESSFGPSPKALQAMREAANGSWMYGDPENYDLRRAIAQHHGVELENVVVGEGIDGLLGLTVQLFAEPTDTVVTSDGAYPTFNFHVLGRGAKLIKVPFRKQKEDLEQLAAMAERHTAKIVYVSNPNNPMGTWWQQDDVRQMHQRLSADCVLILDEAYADTAPSQALLAMDTSVENIIHYRTFSKAYGLAGARIGYAIANKRIIDGFEKIRNHYGVNRTGQIGALAALRDQDYLHETIAKIAAARERLYEIASAHGLAPVTSAANFVAIDCGNASLATAILEQMLSRGIFIRRPQGAGLEHYIRVSCGRPQDIEIFSAQLADVMADL